MGHLSETVNNNKNAVMTMGRGWEVNYEVKGELLPRCSGGGKGWSKPGFRCRDLMRWQVSHCFTYWRTSASMLGQ